MAEPTQAVPVTGRCRWCGPIRLTSSQVRCVLAATDADGLCELECPSCDRLLLRRVRAGEVGLLLQVGARRLSGAAPFELLEAHDGEPIDWDEVLDLHLALEQTVYPQAELSA